MKVELSVGVISNFPGENGHPTEAQTNQVAIICGPEKSIAKHCIARLKIAPGKEKSSDIARRILQQLIARVKDETAKEATKKISIDEIIQSPSLWRIQARSLKSKVSESDY